MIFHTIRLRSALKAFDCCKHFCFHLESLESLFVYAETVRQSQFYIFLPVADCGAMMTTRANEIAIINGTLMIKLDKKNYRRAKCVYIRSHDECKYYYGTQLYFR